MRYFRSEMKIDNIDDLMMFYKFTTFYNENYENKFYTFLKKKYINKFYIFKKDSYLITLTK